MDEGKKTKSLRKKRTRSSKNRRKRTNASGLLSKSAIDKGNGAAINTVATIPEGIDNAVQEEPHEAQPMKNVMHQSNGLVKNTEENGNTVQSKSQMNTESSNAKRLLSNIASEPKELANGHINKKVKIEPDEQDQHKGSLVQQQEEERILEGQGNIDELFAAVLCSEDEKDMLESGAEVAVPEVLANEELILKEETEHVAGKKRKRKRKKRKRKSKMVTEEVKRMKEETNENLINSSIERNHNRSIPAEAKAALWNFTENWSSEEKGEGEQSMVEETTEKQLPNQTICKKEEVEEEEEIIMSEGDEDLVCIDFENGTELGSTSETEKEQYQLESLEGNKGDIEDEDQAGLRKEGYIVDEEEDLIIGNFWNQDDAEELVEKEQAQEKKEDENEEEEGIIMLEDEDEDLGDIIMEEEEEEEESDLNEEEATEELKQENKEDSANREASTDIHIKSEPEEIPNLLKTELQTVRIKNEDDIKRNYNMDKLVAHMPPERKIFEQDTSFLKTGTEEQMQNFMRASKEMLQVVEELLRQPISSDARIQALMKERNALVSQCVLPETAIVLYGDTGSGKSATLNSLLGEENVLPTSGMRACTSVIIELRYNKLQSPRYIAYVEFITMQEWHQELERIFHDLRGEGGRVINRTTDSKSQAAVALQKLRLIYGPEVTKKANLVLEKLKRWDNVVTRALGTTQQVTSNEPHDFRRRIETFADSSNDKEQLCYWPVVKKIAMSGPWDVLKAGTILVDAPGLRDDNSVRDAVVKNYLKDSDSIWIVANIKRAVDDKTAKDMLGESFRRQLLMDGQYGSLAFIATHSDILNRSELAYNLNLPPTSTREECAKQRNIFTKQRIAGDFKEGIREMVQMAKHTRADGCHYQYLEEEEEQQEGESSDNDLGHLNYDLPVFTVSAMDYQKMIGNFPLDGPPETFTDIEDTEIPALRRFSHGVAIKRRFETICRHGRNLIELLGLVEHLLFDNSLQEEIRERAKTQFYMGISNLKKHMIQTSNTFLLHFQQTITSSLELKLEDGAGAADAACLATVAKWGAPKEQGGLHWSTYRATCKRDGEYNSPTSGPTDFNSQLTEPLSCAISIEWNTLFSATINKLLQQHKEELVNIVGLFLEQFSKYLTGLGVEEDFVNRTHTQQRMYHQKRMQDSMEEILAFILHHQKEISRCLTPHVKERMIPGYRAAAEVVGAGTFARMKEIVHSHAEANKSTMFISAAHVLIQALNNMLAHVSQMIHQLHISCLSSLELHNQGLWEALPIDNMKLRDLLLPKVRQLHDTVCHALQQVKSVDGVSSAYDIIAAQLRPK